MDALFLHFARLHIIAEYAQHCTHAKCSDAVSEIF